MVTRTFQPPDGANLQGGEEVLSQGWNHLEQEREPPPRRPRQTPPTVASPEGPAMGCVSSCAHVFLRLPHPRKLLLFALLSVADLTLTWALIQYGRGQFYEGNPVAAWFLRSGGWS